MSLGCLSHNLQSQDGNGTGYSALQSVLYSWQENYSFIDKIEAMSSKLNRTVAIWTLCFLTSSLWGRTFYVDPSIGRMDHDGSKEAPWSTLEEVIASNLIESFTNSPLPYEVSTNKKTIKNAGSPVQGGDTLILLSGLHGSVFLQNFNNAVPIVIMGKEGELPVLRKVHFQACRNWKLENVSISSEPYGAYHSETLIYIESHGWQGPSSQIEVHNNTIFSSEMPWDRAEDWITNVSHGIIVRGDSIKIIDNQLRNIGLGISAQGDYVEVLGNSVINFSKDGLRILGSYGLYEGNLIKNCYDIDDNHDDGIQSFTTGGLVVDHNVVRGNIILNYEDPDQPLLGPLQGIGCFDGMYNGWIIENNLVHVNHWHGITFLGANDCNIINNTVIDPTPDVTPGPSWIRIADHKDGSPSSNCVVMNNISNRFVVDGKLGHNAELTTYDQYRLHFEDFDHQDFNLNEGSTLIDSANQEQSPVMDLVGTARPQGGASDIGCYEYINITTSSMIVEQESLHVYPNPATNWLWVKHVPVGARIQIYSALGQRQKLISNASGNLSVDITYLEPGIYFLKFDFAGQLQVVKFIKH